MLHQKQGNAPGIDTPIEKAPAVSDDCKGLTTDTNELHFRIDGAANQAQYSSAIAAQIAQLALAGHHVHKGHTGNYLVCKYGMSRYCQDFTELQSFARQLGVNK